MIKVCRENGVHPISPEDYAMGWADISIKIVKCKTMEI